ncbi:flagellar hook-basal body complex protein FliE [Maridesulfovibrio bastinii]|jgi:flagellar hook-basal body complex protein FliE|uniref:flagellar hook-basal body complex protein FliE n=1 Tax=Maridesulfovibrio bastinii TaxID=47157 RepID=UPI0003FEA22B|nr:flagellar hook-basal body complex protein FliE [Maridesulfovibrio bastinii]
MAIRNVAMQAYTNALNTQKAAQKKIENQMGSSKAPTESFSDTVKNSIGRVNDMEENKYKMITEFASGENENVHELMITLQKASLAMQMTSAVRSKVMTAYQEVMKMPF